MRGIGLLAAALLVTVLAHFGVPLPQTDPFRSTLVLLPLMVTALVGIGIWANERGGWSTPTEIATSEAIVLVLLILVTLGRSHLGLRSEDLIDRCLAGGFALLLIHRVAWLVAALRSTLGSGLPRYPPSAFLALPVVVYLAILPWTTTQRPPDGDAPHYLLLTHSLAYDFDTDLRNNYQQGDSLRFVDLRLEPQLGDPVGKDGQLYSRHNMLLPLILAPFYRLEGLLGTLIVMALLTSLTCWLTLALARFYSADRPAEAVVAWAILAFTAPFILFSYQIWVEIPAALLVVAILLQIHRLRSDESATWKSWAGLTISMSLLPLLKIRFLILAVPLAGLTIWYGGRRARRWGTTLLLFVLMLAAATFWFNQLVFQNPLKYHDIDGLRSYSLPAGQYLRGLVGLFFDCAFGLIANAPIWALLIPAALLLIRQRQRLLGDFILVFLPYLLILSPRGEWFGAWSPPYRYGVVMLPLLALALVPMLAEPIRYGGGKLLAALTIVTVTLTTLWLVVPGWTFNLAHGRSHLLDLLSTSMAADTARFFPSSTRVRAATFIWPAASLITIGLGWWLGKRVSLRRALVGGVIMALIAPAVVVWASQRRATGLVEFEDPWLEASEGKVYPDLWVVYRPRYRGGWTLPEGGSIRVPVIAGGEILDLEIDLLARPPKGERALIEVSNNSGRVVAESVTRTFGEWTTLSMEGLPWSPGDDLTLTFRAPVGERSHGYRVILDRARFSWR